MMRAGVFNRLWNDRRLDRLRGFRSVTVRELEGVDEEVVFRLGSELVGADPVTVQAMLLSLSDDFLQSLERPLLLPSQVRRQQGVTAYVLDPAAARRWWTRLKRWSPRPSNPGP